MPDRTAQGARVDAHEGHHHEGEDRDPEQRPRSGGELWQCEADEQAGHEALRAIPADQGQGVENAVYQDQLNPILSGGGPF